MLDSRLRSHRLVPVVLTLLCGVVSAPALAHDMFLVVDDHDVPVEAEVTVALYNGTFEESANVIDRERMVDVSVVDPQGEVTHPESGQWREDGNVTLLDFQTGKPGSYLVGVSTAPRGIDLSAEDFAEYLRHDGILDLLETREKEGIADRPAHERYSKHVKILLRVGGASSGSYSRRLGYPVEIVPLADPSALAAGDELELLVLLDGAPLAGQLVYASYAGYHAHGEGDSHREPIRVRTDQDGRARLKLSQAGRWYARLIHMAPSEEQGVDYESRWATLTFEVGD